MNLSIPIPASGTKQRRQSISASSNNSATGNENNLSRQNSETKDPQRQSTLKLQLGETLKTSILGISDLLKSG